MSALISGVLHVPNNCLTDDSIPSLVKIMTANPLSDIDLTNNKITCEGAEMLAKFLSSGNVGRSKLRRLDLSLNNISHPGCKALCKVLEASRSIRHLDLSSNRLGPESAECLSSLVEKIFALNSSSKHL